MKLHYKQPLQQSLLDKLIDDTPGQKDTGRSRRGFDLKALRQSVRRDLENLLNSRVQWHTWPQSYRELPQSLLNYGLPDFSVMVVDSDEGRLQLCRAVEQTIRRFEPRFVDVDVTVPEQEHGMERVLRLRIQALLYADPEPEHIMFDSEVEPVHLGLTIRDYLA
ncbi:type VI secretion system baseplate subunit TssE [Rheinheimera aquimaris]|uniref:type VI secretion system baseplate subunit TssE n=1 Tax=Rheinheimera aquimaris TaxID=412437 RepID=UPI001E4D5240|nr:type VI secretion system baseplate subunit TssE [Rheinheimera aquimaris]MCD1600165.1 type VI secretion system baseplate subunit TssE [Rheinheimera aquimaris]